METKCNNCCELNIGDRVEIINGAELYNGNEVFTGTTGKIDGFYKKNAVIVHLDIGSSFYSDHEKHFITAMVCHIDSLIKIEGGE